MWYDVASPIKLRAGILLSKSLRLTQHRVLQPNMRPPQIANEHRK